MPEIALRALPNPLPASNAPRSPFYTNSNMYVSPQQLQGRRLISPPRIDLTNAPSSYKVHLLLFLLIEFMWGNKQEFCRSENSMSSPSGVRRLGSRLRLLVCITEEGWPNVMATKRILSYCMQAGRKRCGEGKARRLIYICRHSHISPEIPTVTLGIWLLLIISRKVTFQFRFSNCTPLYLTRSTTELLMAAPVKKLSFHSTHLPSALILHYYS